MLKIVGNQILCQISIVLTATLLLILQTVLTHIQLMSTKKQISTLCNLHSKYEEIPEDFLDDFAFQFCDSKLQQQFILKKEVSISKKQV